MRVLFSSGQEPLLKISIGDITYMVTRCFTLTMLIPMQIASKAINSAFISYFVLPVGIPNSTAGWSSLAALSTLK